MLCNDAMAADRGRYLHVLVACLFFGCRAASAVEYPSDCFKSEHKVYLRSGVIDLCNAATTRGRRVLYQGSDASLTEPSAATAATHQFILTFAEELSPDKLAAVEDVLRANGGKSVSYLPENSVLALMPQEAVAVVEAVPGVLWIGEWHPTQRQSPELAELRQAVHTQGVATVSEALDMAATVQDHRQQPPVVKLPAALRHAVDIDYVTAESGTDVLRVALDVMLVRELLPLAAGLSAGGLADAQADILSAVHSGRDSAAAAEAVQAEQSVRAGLVAACSGDAACQVADSSETRLIVKVPLQQLDAAVTFLAAHPAVHWLTLHSAPRAANFYGTAISQCGASPATYDVQYLGNPNYVYNNQGKDPLWNAGLRGSGQILGMGDTGLDLDSCFFRDDNFPDTSAGNFPPDASGFPLFNSTSHRKLAMYRALSDSVDANGHGTHCGGSAVGSYQSGSLAWWTGMAPDAKIAFTDIGVGTSGSLPGVPANLTRSYYPWPYVRGARVHSDSWTTTKGVYDTNSMSVDLFSWLFQEFLPVFAAGNFGGDLVDGTIASPSTAKNCIAVGAGLTSLYKDSSSFPVYQPALDINSVIYTVNVTGGLKASGADGIAYTVMLASFGPTLAAAVASTATSKLQLVVSDPLDGCTPLNRPVQFAGKVLIIQRDNCSFASKVVNGQDAGAAAVLIANSENTGFMRMNLDPPTPGFDQPNITIPSASLPRNSARPLLAALASGQTLQLAVATASLPRDRFESLAYFTSIGPAPDGRIKPDIVAPGTTISAHPGSTAQGTESCEVGIDMGTSMATPITAGAAVVVRQYFEDGWYPSGQPQAQNSFIPSAPLVKAVMLGGAVSMQGVTPSSNSLYDGVPLEPAPSVRQGFGRLQLGNSLPVGTASTLKMQVVNKAPLTAPGQSQKYCVRSTGGDISITLAWADYPCSPAAATCLVNDLDLSVQASGLAGYTLYGNGQPDRLNNVERAVAVANDGSSGTIRCLGFAQVSSDDLDAGLVVITVSAVTLPLPQLYSLVVQGSFSGQLASSYNPAWDGTTPLCIEPTFNITGPSGTVRSRSASFSFTSSEALPNGAECRLGTVTGVTTPVPLSDWVSCTSPKAYSAIPDGPYQFSVRAKGSALQTSQLFTVDATPPTIRVASFSATTRRASIVFTGVDASTVSFQCMLNRTASAASTASVPLVPSDPPQLLGQYQACASPVAFSSLPDGNYALAIKATDGAGNVGTAPTTRAWAVTAPTYAQITAVNATARKINFASVSTAAMASPLALECRLQNDSDATKQATLDSAAGYSACTSPQTFSGLEDGQYIFSARTVGAAAGYQSSASFTIGAPRPRVTIVTAPAGLLTSTLAQFGFVSSGDVSFECSLGFSNAAPNYTTCVSPLSYDDLADGVYMFLVRASSSGGVTGPAVQTSFQVDARPPSISGVSFTEQNADAPSTIRTVNGEPSVNIASNTFTIAFTAADAPGGSGIDRILGRLAPLAGAATRSVGRAGVGVTVAAATSQETASAEAATTSFQAMVSPLLVTLADGVYTFAVYAVDRAGNAGSTGEYQITVGSGRFAPLPPSPPPPPSPPSPRSKPGASKSAADRAHVLGIVRTLLLVTVAAAAVML